MKKLIKTFGPIILVYLLGAGGYLCGLMTTLFF